MANLSSSRKYCGTKWTPLTFSFPSCAAVVLNFRSDSSVSDGGFKVHYTVRDLGKWHVTKCISICQYVNWNLMGSASLFCL